MEGADHKSRFSAHLSPDVVLDPPPGTVSGNCQKLPPKQGNAVRSTTARLGGRLRLTFLEGTQNVEPGARSHA